MSPTRTAFLLIGGAGFMGSAFARHLEATGATVVTVGRGASLEDAAKALAARDPGHCTVVDFAYTSVPNSSFEDPVGDYSDNLYNLLRHVEFVRSLPHATYIYISSGGTVYGNPDDAVPIDEAHRNVPLAPYGITKLACERYALMYQQVHGLDVKIVRPSNVYGPGQRPFRGQGIVSTMLARLMGGHGVRMFGDGSTVRDYLYVTDFCRALDDVIRFGRNGEIYNIGSGEGVDITGLLARMQTCLGKPTIEVERLPMRPFDVRYNVLDPRKLRTLNGWSPRVSLDDGLAQSAAWLSNRVDVDGA